MMFGCACFAPRSSSWLSPLVCRAVASFRRLATTNDGGVPQSHAVIRETNSFHANETYDVFIVGGGVVGATLARRLADCCPNLSIGLLDSRRPPPLSTYAIVGNGGNYKAPMARAYALSPSSLLTIGIDDVVESIRVMGLVSPFDEMQVWESNGPGTLRFSASDIQFHPEQAVAEQGELGVVVEHAPLVAALWDLLSEQSLTRNSLKNNGRFQGRMELIAPAMVTDVEIPCDDAISGNLVGNNPASLTYRDGTSNTERTIRTHLLVAADGANSFLRKKLTVPTFSWDYERKAVIAVVELNGNLKSVAYQRFSPSGPLAMLPMWDGRYANIIWSTTAEHAEELKSLSKEQFVQEINDELQVGPANSPPLLSEERSSNIPRLLREAAYGLDMIARSVGEGLAMASWVTDPFQLPPRVSSVLGQQFAFNLSLNQARRYALPRFALVGDAAHTVHPMAGQGLNLGIGDAECLARYIKTASDSGMDVGEMYFLEQFQKERQIAVGSMMAGIHMFHVAFSADLVPAIWLRSIGVNMVNIATPIRRQLALAAAGYSGG